ncbi:dehydrogenase [Paenibacillus sediminis]|uniref:Toxin CptA n=1 Tax=Paenibacillus sediminis TaxID=664909 RepID=A0ABS4H3L9_9BACL|nr:dehydrogenase [Paenibacillus sediminis]MBP1937114.1 toxin CptA [Paenibacillus sediminis]
MNKINEKHQSSLPSPRKIRRACSKELYRTVKRLKVYIAPELFKQGEELYFKKVINNLLWIVENQSNRKKLADWWHTDVSSELAELWKIDRTELSQAFRDAFGG